METNVVFLQDVQEAYAQLLDLSLVLVDLDGNEVTDVSNFNALTKLFHTEWGHNQQYLTLVESMKSLDKSSIIDNRMGIKLVVSPILVQNKPSYYLLSGYMLEESTREHIRQYAKLHFPELKGFSEALDEIPELTEAEKAEKLNKINTLKQVIEAHLSAQKNNQSINQSFSFLHKSLEGLQKGTATASAFIEELYHQDENIDFIGLAIEKEDSCFMVDSVFGPNTEFLIDHSFVLGEGFLGHTLAALQVKFWEDVSQDPRITFFYRSGLRPKSLFCLPIFQESKVIGLLFGGSTKETLRKVDCLQSLTMHASFLSTLVTSNYLKENNQNQLLELTTFNEVFRVMTTVKDIKRVLYILVDMSINTMRGPFSCIVYRPIKHQSKIDIVSRGLTSSEINEFGYDVAVRAFSGSSSDYDLKQPLKRKTSWGVDVFELPLFFNDQLYGVLAVGLTTQHELSKYQAFLSSLAVAGSISIHLCQQQNGAGADDSIIDLLYEVMKQQNNDQHEQALKIKNHVSEFTSYLNDGNYQSLKKICGLIFFEKSLLENYLSDREMLAILTDYEQLIVQKKATRKDSEILRLVSYFVMNKEEPSVIHDLSEIRAELKEQFQAFLNQQAVVETVISLNERPVQIEETPPSKEVHSSVLKEKLNLSSREIEVLNQLMQGFNNREIASNLFISEHTVKNHITHIFQKLNVGDRAQAIAMIYKLGYVPS